MFAGRRGLGGRRQDGATGEAETGHPEELPPVGREEGGGISGTQICTHRSRPNARRSAAVNG
ncbi:hypothetical protein GCM10028799_25480 [Kribbella italica]